MKKSNKIRKAKVFVYLTIYFSLKAPVKKQAGPQPNLADDPAIHIAKPQNLL